MKFLKVLHENGISVYASGATSMNDVAGTDTPSSVDWMNKPQKVVRRFPKTSQIFRKKINKKDKKNV